MNTSVVAPQVSTSNRQPNVRKRRRNKGEGGEFRLLIGSHLGQGPDGCDCDECTRDDEHRGKNHLYDANDQKNNIVKADEDLELLCNQGPYSRKFERVHKGATTQAIAQAQPPAPFPLDRMSVAQLIAVAEEEEVDLKAAKTKEDILKVLRAAGK